MRTPPREEGRPIVGECHFSKIGTSLVTIYVYGEVRYVDAFGKERLTTYRLMHGGPDRANPGALSTCAEGNDAT